MENSADAVSVIDASEHDTSKPNEMKISTPQASETEEQEKTQEKEDNEDDEEDREEKEEKEEKEENLEANTEGTEDASEEEAEEEAETKEETKSVEEVEKSKDEARISKLEKEEKESAEKKQQEQRRESRVRSRKASVISVSQQAKVVVSEKVAEDEFWAKQDDHFQSLVARLHLMVRTAKATLKHVTKTSKMIQTITDVVKDLGVFAEADEMGTLKSTTDDYEVLCRSTSSLFHEAKERTFGGCVDKAAAMVKALEKKVNEIINTNNKVVKEVKVERLKLLPLFEHYQNAVKTRATRDPTGKIKTDPYLLCRSYEIQLGVVRAAEEKYRKHITKMYNDVLHEDARRIQEIKHIMLENVKAIKSIMDHGSKFALSAMQTIELITPETDINEFSSQYTIKQDEAAQVESVAHANSPVHAISSSCVFNALPPEADTQVLHKLYREEVEKGGKLSRQGKIIKKNWHEMNAVVTKSGFLHAFENKNVALSIPLIGCVVAPSGSIELALEIRLPSSGFSSFFSKMGTTHVLQAESEPEMQAWVEVISGYTKS